MLHHGAGLRTILTNDGVDGGAQDALLAELSAGRIPPTSSAADRAMLDYAVRLTEEPWSIGTDDIDRLREAGFDDRAVHDICSVTAYFAFVNRIADGLGVELEERFEEGHPGEARPSG